MLLKADWTDDDGVLAPNFLVAGPHFACELDLRRNLFRARLIIMRGFIWLSCPFLLFWAELKPAARIVQK